VIVTETVDDAPDNFRGIVLKSADDAPGV